MQGAGRCGPANSIISFCFYLIYLVFLFCYTFFLEISFLCPAGPKRQRYAQIWTIDLQQYDSLPLLSYCKASVIDSATVPNPAIEAITTVFPNEKVIRATLSGCRVSSAGYNVPGSCTSRRSRSELTSFAMRQSLQKPATNMYQSLTRYWRRATLILSPRSESVKGFRKRSAMILLRRRL